MAGLFDVQPEQVPNRPFVRADANGTVIVRLAGADSVRAELDAIARESVTVI